MRRSISNLALLAFMSSPLLAQEADFQREGKPAQRAQKDPLEGKLPPPLEVGQWMNVGGASASLADFRGKVIVLDFWGVW